MIRNILGPCRPLWQWTLSARHVRRCRPDVLSFVPVSDLVGPARPTLSARRALVCSGPCRPGTPDVVGQTCLHLYPRLILGGALGPTPQRLTKGPNPWSTPWSALLEHSYIRYSPPKRLNGGPKACGIPWSTLPYTPPTSPAHSAGACASLGRPSGGRFGVEILHFGRPSWERKSSKNVGGLVKNQHFGLPLPSWFGERFRSHLGTIFDPEMAPKSLPEGLPKRLRKGDPKKSPPRAPNGPQDPQEPPQNRPRDGQFLRATGIFEKVKSKTPPGPLREPSERPQGPPKTAPGPLQEAPGTPKYPPDGLKGPRGLSLTFATGSRLCP